MSHAFILNAQRRRWEAMFDAVAGAALVIAPDRVLTIGEKSDIVVAALLGSPDNNVGDMTDLVMALADAIEAGDRALVSAAIERGKPRAENVAWATAGRMVAIVRRVRELDEDTIERVIVVIRMIGEHPLMLGFPS